MMKTRFLKSILFLLLLALAGASSVLAQDTVEQLVPKVLDVRPHDPASFTEGLMLHDGLLYETSGLYGQSSLRQVDPETGKVLLSLRLPDQVFGEGLALVDDYFYVLTWRAQVAFHINLSAFTEHKPVDASLVHYQGEGWGMCYDGEHLYMSNGSDTLAVRDPKTFDVVDTLQVTYEGTPLGEMAYDGMSIGVPTPSPSPEPLATPVRVADERVDLLNELECVGDSIYSNVWKTDFIFRIDKATGAVTGQIDAAGLLDAQDQVGADVLNGIVYLPDSDTFLITGKLWPKMFEVVFVPPDEAATP